MIPGFAKYNSGDIEVRFTAEGTLTDLGVPRSPTFIEWDNVEISGLVILGLDVDPESLPESLLDAIYEIAQEVDFEDADS